MTPAEHYREADRLLVVMEADADAADTARAVAQQDAEGA